jgi:hypothetical protein
VLLEIEGVCAHHPGPINTFCDRCDALVLAGVMLSGACGHERLFPPEWTWTPRSWCGVCERVGSFGTQPLRALSTPRLSAPFLSPFWDREFGTQVEDGRRHSRPFPLDALGIALGRPSAAALARRAGMRWPRSLYRWRSYGLTDVLADTLAINCCLHPSDVWGEQWWAAAC